MKMKCRLTGLHFQSATAHELPEDHDVINASAGIHS